MGRLGGLPESPGLIWASYRTGDIQSSTVGPTRRIPQQPRGRLPATIFAPANTASACCFADLLKPVSLHPFVTCRRGVSRGVIATTPQPDHAWASKRTGSVSCCSVAMLEPLRHPSSCGSSCGGLCAYVPHRCSCRLITPASVARQRQRAYLRSPQRKLIARKLLRWALPRSLNGTGRQAPLASRSDWSPYRGICVTTC